MLLLTSIVPRRVVTVDNLFNKQHKVKESFNFSFKIRYKSDNIVVRINDVSKPVTSPKIPEYVPTKYLTPNSSQESLRHMRWMLQKDILGQDMFLIGSPGLKRRHLAMAFSELTEREVEFISISRDTTEADLKQRKEIKNGTAHYHDQSALQAAINGRLLILEGIEKAERNVLPVLNNLLENREMHLEDGRFLIPAQRYDKLLKEFSQKELDAWGLVRVSEDFRVIALGLPSTRYFGHPLDPPLRSRFQARYIAPPSYEEQLTHLKNLAPNVDSKTLSQLLSSCHALVTEEAVSLALPDFPLDNLPIAAFIVNNFPDLPVYHVFYRLYPYKLFLNDEARTAVEDILSKFGLLDNKTANNLNTKFSFHILNKSNSCSDIIIEYDNKKSSPLKIFHDYIGKKELKSPYVETDYQNSIIAQMLQSQLHCDTCLVGPKGCGKTVIIQKLAELLNCQVESIVLYQDMTSRDLLQYRTTLSNGDTIWKDSPLITAALEGKLAVLDGIHRVHPSTLAVIYRLVQDRELQLSDGKRLLRSDRYDKIKELYNKSDDEVNSMGIYKIHPSFKIVALAESPHSKHVTGRQWLNAELLSMFSFHEMRFLDKSEEIRIIKKKYEVLSQSLLNVIELAHYLRSTKDPALQPLAYSLSTRQLLRIAEKMQKFPDDDAYDAVSQACLARFLPVITKTALENTMKKFNILPKPSYQTDIQCIVNQDHVIIGNTTIQRYKTDSLTKVPDVLFYDVPQHLILLEKLMKDFTLGHNLLLVGNQGVGKNKIVDRLLYLLNKPREYIQLHRDTTVQTLTVQIMVKKGIVVYEDSPLVKAVKLGHVLVVDEADKAPTHVTCILKTLVESGEMVLSDGRRIVSAQQNDNLNKSLIPMHPDFRLIVLANRPGFPFLGNDFFGAIGDLFSTHSVDNPSFENEIHLLKQYGPDVNEEIVNRLVKAFGELRNMSDQGLVSYPYSTREVVNIIKHLQKFPNEPLASVVNNVFDFDRSSQEVFDTLIQVLNKHEIPLGVSLKNVTLAKTIPLPDLKFCGAISVNNSLEVLNIQEKQLKCKYISKLQQKSVDLAKVNVRSSWFTEMKSYWNLPIRENSTAMTLSVDSGIKQDGSDDKIFVLTINPFRLYNTTLNSKSCQEIKIDILENYLNVSKPKFTLTNDKKGNVILHENLTNMLFLIDPLKLMVYKIKSSSIVDTANDKMFQVLSNRNLSWKLKTDLIKLNNQIVFFSQNYNKIKIIDLELMKESTITTPFKIYSIIFTAPDTWLIQSVTNEEFILQKSVDSFYPNTLRKIDKSNLKTFEFRFLETSNKDNLQNEVMSKLVDQTVNFSNRIVATNDSYASIILGVPDLKSEAKIFSFPRNCSVKGLPEPIVLPQGQVIRNVSVSEVSTSIMSENNSLNICSYLEIADPVEKTLRYIPISAPSKISPMSQWIHGEQLPLYSSLTSTQDLITMDVNGRLRLWEISLKKINHSFGEWKKMLGSDNETLQITKERYSGLDAQSPKHGKIDPNNQPHIGGNTWAGGTGGRDTAGLGGKGGPYRLDAGHTVYQLSDEEKNDVPDHIKKAAREMGKKMFEQRLRDISMSEYDAKLYDQFSNAVKKEVQSLRIILESLQTKSNERQWSRHQTSGELDDTKLIESITGEKTIYKRRAEKEAEIGAPQFKPKHLKLVVDVSGSMYRFNGYDGRLDREMEASIMVMEAFNGYENKIKYDIVGHSGDHYNISFVNSTRPPQDNKLRLEIIKKMHAHAQFCISGDYTLEAAKNAISTVAKEDTDEAIVVIFSDANLERYGIRPESLTKILTSKSNVKAYAIFIGSLGDQASRLIKRMPSGTAFECMDLKNIPRILQQIFAASVLNTVR